MEFDVSWVLLGLPLAFMLGWVASRFDLRQMRLDNRQAPKAYFKGLNFLLHEQHDQAIDAFIEAVQIDPDTSELHFALGNLFRRRGEYERAVRVHEHLLSRGDLSTPDRHRARYALAIDFLKAGLLDRAEAALAQLEGTSFEAEALQALLTSHERSRDWVQAAKVAARLEHSGQGSFCHRIAHYLCEQAAAHLAHGELEPALNLLRQATALASDAARPPLDLARLLHNRGQTAEAFLVLSDALDRVTTATPLIAPLYAQLAMATDQAGGALPRLISHYLNAPSLDVLDAIVMLTHAHVQFGPHTAAPDWYIRHLVQEPSLVAALRWVTVAMSEQPLPAPVLRAIDHAAVPLLRYRCAACGFESTQHFWQCPGCQTWDSYPARRVEEL